MPPHLAQSTTSPNTGAPTNIPVAPPVSPGVSTSQIPTASPVIPPHLRPPPAPPATPTVATNPAAMAAGPLPPHLAKSGAAPIATPSAPATNVAIGDEDRKENSLKAEYTKPKGSLGVILVMMGAVLVLIFVVSLVAVFSNNPDLLSWEETTVITTNDASPYPDAVEKEVTWTDTSKSALIDEVRVKIERVQYGAILAKDENNVVQKSASSNYLQVYLIIENTGREGAISYKSWYGSEFEVSGQKFAATLRDDTGQTYPMMTFGDVSRIAGHVDTATLATNNTGDNQRFANDVVVYELPETLDPSSHKFYRLEMPAAAFGGRGAVRFQIPAESILDN